MSGYSGRVRRRVQACTRCRHRKIQCETGASSSCTACVDAGVQCAAEDPATRMPAPRSVTRYLEDCVNKAWEQNVLSLSRSPNSIGPRDHDSASDQTHLLIFGTECPASEALSDITAPFLGLTSCVPLAGCARASTQIPPVKEPVTSSLIYENHQHTISNQQPSTLPPSSIPIHVAKFLFDTYTARIVPQYPIFHIEEVENAFKAVYYRAGAQSYTDPRREARNSYIISLIMAISLSTAARSKERSANLLATGLFRYAMMHAGEVLSNDLAGLQSLLLLIQYAFLNPAVANLWLLTGLSSEACIDMGLHIELPALPEVTVLERDLRRRVFYCAWEMEIAVCAGFHRPLRTLSKYISVSFPSEIEDHAISQYQIDTTASRTKFICRQIWLFRQIESSIVEILYQNEPLPADCSSLEDWMTKIENEISDWNFGVHQSAASGAPCTKPQWDEMKLYANIAYNWILVLLFRPWPGRKTLSRENLIKAFRAAVHVATGYWEQANTTFGYIKYVFHPCHQTFSSAMVFLHALQSCKAEIADLYTLEEVEQFTHSFPRFFSRISERWPAAARCLQEYERLLSPVKKEYSDFFLQRRQHERQDISLHASHSTELFESTADFPISLDLSPVLNPSVDTVGFDSQDPASLIPYDWNTEFDFGMDLTV